MHADGDVLPTNGLYVPAGQATHADDEVLPTDGLYVPDRHFAQET
jgi:hypothetical protein